MQVQCNILGRIKGILSHKISVHVHMQFSVHLSYGWRHIKVYAHGACSGMAEGDAASSATPVTDSCRPSVSQEGRETMVIAYRWCRLSIVFIAAVSTAVGGSFSCSAITSCVEFLASTRRLAIAVLASAYHGPVSTMPLATNDWSPVAYFICGHGTDRRWRHYEPTRWFLGAQEINAWSDYRTNRGRALSCDSILLTGQIFI